ncbi:MAG: acyltransferase [Proteobacteria bacterium]|nr:acyltransferase [Pseudomonadota bacterium]MCL2309132.1 acyltransferase [Pseudomonadota bacterium]
MRSVPARLPILDAVKAIACQLIVLHHLAFYGPMSDTAFFLAPGLFVWLSQYGRMAVQVFFVIAGFLAARHLFSLDADSFPFWKTVGRRYYRLIIPFSAAMLAAILAAAVARFFMGDHYSIPAPPSFFQFILHLLLVQDIFGVNALSAGVWYIAIDFQLFFVTLLISFLSWRLTKDVSLRFFLCFFLLVCLGLASLFYFNRDEKWDCSFLYFAAYYIFGIVAYLTVSKAKHRLYIIASISSLVLITILALSLDFRVRIIVALCAVLFFIIFFYVKELRNYPQNTWLQYLGQISYSIFLIHFPVCLIINSLFYYWAPDDPSINFFGLFVAWGSSLLCGALFFHYIERIVFQKRLFPNRITQR